MAHGAPDYFNVNPMELFYSLSDLGELAARLGCPSKIDRRGKVIWYDDFTNGDGAWEKDPAPAGGYIGTAIAPSLSPGGALRLNAGTDRYAVASARVYLMPPLTARYGIEWSWTHSRWAVFQTMYITMVRNLRGYDFMVWYMPMTGQVFVQGTGTPSREVYVFSGGPAYMSIYHNYKLVLDNEALSGVRLLIDGRYVDISDYRFSTYVSTYQDMLSVELSITNYTSGGNEMYVDNVIYTMGE